MLWTIQVSMVPPNQSLKCNFFQKKNIACLKLRPTLHILEEHGFLDLGEYLMLHTRESGPEALEFLSDCLRRQLLHG